MMLLFLHTVSKNFSRTILNPFFLPIDWSEAQWTVTVRLIAYISLYHRQDLRINKKTWFVSTLEVLTVRNVPVTLHSNSIYTG